MRKKEMLNDEELDELLGDLKESKPKKETVKVPPTLMANMDAIVRMSLNSGLNKDFYKRAKPCIDFLKAKLGISEHQAVFISLFTEFSCSQPEVYFGRITGHLDCSNLQLLSFQDELDALCKLGYLRKCGMSVGLSNEKAYKVPEKVIDALKSNKPFVPESDYNLTIDKFFSRICEIFDENDDSQEIKNEILDLMAKNTSLGFVKDFLKMCKQTNISEVEKYIFLNFCNRAVNEGEKRLTTSDIVERIRPVILARNIRCKIENGTSPLLTEKLIESVPEGGMYGPEFSLTKSAIDTFLSDFCLVDDVSNRNVVKWDSFAEKHMFYNKEEKEQVDRLADLLKEENFVQVQKRLESKGLRKGFACLFYGAPGTGKTETVNQLARITGRDVLVVDVSQVKDKFVGESEKNIKNAFDKYAELVKKSAKAPILFFNEADAILGKRMEGVERAVDKMENSIQNIILQEMEKLEGIMIATTNLTDNLDKAFERRFIYKIEFRNPSVEAKKNIWLDMIPEMDEHLAERLARDYDFSGGQIENVVRKSSVNYILTGKDPSESEYVGFCECEKINKKDKINRLGFVK